MHCTQKRLEEFQLLGWVSMECWHGGMGLIYGITGEEVDERVKGWCAGGPTFSISGIGEGEG